MHLRWEGAGQTVEQVHSHIMPKWNENEIPEVDSNGLNKGFH